MYESNLLQDIYEGGQEGTKDRYNEKYGDDVANFNVANSNIKNGLVEDRGCTDIICLGVWIAFIASLFYLTWYGNANGNVRKLIAPIDGDHKLCGEAQNFESMRFLYLTDFSPESVISLFDSGVCVDKCPSAADAPIGGCENTAGVPDCTAVKVRKTFKVLTYCVPDFTDGTSWTPEVKKKWMTVWDTFLATSAGSSVNDLYLASNAIWASIALAPIYCFIFIAIMSAFAEYIAWVCVALVQLGLIAGAVCCYLYKATLTKNYNLQNALLADESDAYERANLGKNYNTNQNYLTGGMVVFGLLAFLFLCCIVVGWKSLKLAIDVIDASADFLYKTKRIIVVPIFYFLVTLLIVFLWIGAFICVLSMNKVKASTVIPQMKSITWTSEANYYLMWYMIFALIWLVSHIEYTNQFIIQVSAASYYFDSNAE